MHFVSSTTYIRDLRYAFCIINNIYKRFKIYILSHLKASAALQPQRLRLQSIETKNTVETTAAVGSKPKQPKRCQIIRFRCGVLKLGHGIVQEPAFVALVQFNSNRLLLKLWMHQRIYKPCPNKDALGGTFFKPTLTLESNKHTFERTTFKTELNDIFI
jgi:hypothetical protein